MKFGRGRNHSVATAALLPMALNAGCYAPGYNSYSTARTIPRGGVAAGFYAEASGHSGEVRGEDETFFAIFPPGFAGRVGLSERLDIGVHVAGLGAFSFGGDLKWLVLPGDALDLALDPGIDYVHLFRAGAFGPGTPTSRSFDFWRLRAPIVTGINVSSRVVVVLTTGFVYGLPASDLGVNGLGDQGRIVDGAAPLVGLGLNLRAGPSVAFHPESTFVFSTAENERRFIYTVGFALQFGRLPRILRAGEGKPPPRPEDGDG
jgi:hypothetical protein